jgi:hypothetical protein
LVGDDYDRFKEEETNALKMATILRQLNSPKRLAVQKKMQQSHGGFNSHRLERINSKTGQRKKKMALSSAAIERA